MLNKPITGPGQLGPCHCPPDKCMAPVIMGRQTPCLRSTAPVEPNCDRSACGDYSPGDCDHPDCPARLTNERRVMPLVEMENWNDRLQEHV